MALLVGILSGCTEETTPIDNTAPEAAFSITQDGLTITFDGSNSSDADGDELIYYWSFGDVETDTGPGEKIATHSYATPGTYTAMLAVHDGTVLSDLTTVEITVANPPTVTLGSLPEIIMNNIDIIFEATVVEGDAEFNATTGHVWSIDNGTGEVVQEGETAATFTTQFAEDGTYIVKVVATDDLDNTGEASVTVVVPTEPA